MNGPHNLTRDNVDRRVDDRIGVYKHYNSRSGPVKYVGMSEELATRLKGHVNDYRYFEYEYQSSLTAAYKREANLYHHHGGKTKLDNQRHPPCPHNRVKCPACSVHD